MKICPDTGAQYDHTPEEWRKFNGGYVHWAASGSVHSPSLRGHRSQDQESPQEPSPSQPDAEGQQDPPATKS